VAVTRDHIPQQVEAIAQSFSAVRAIWWNWGDDWNETESLFFRVVISDETACERERLRQVAREVTEELIQAFWDFAPVYVNFRSVSECERMKEKEWAA
jgi:hypothetical protein